MKDKMLDSNVFVHAFLEPKENISPRELEIKKKSLNIVKTIQEAELKVLMTTVQIFEIANLLESWLGHEASRDVVSFVVTTSNIKIYKVSKKDLEDGLEISERYKSNKIGLNDCVTYVAMKNINVNEIYSFDRHFDQFSDITRLEE